MKHLVAVLVSLLLFGSAASANVVGACDDDTYGVRAKELQDIVKADQDDRKTMPLPPSVAKRDLKRRMRVGEIFGEGCFKSAADFAAAALVFQHGMVPEHFLQTFMWSRKIKLLRAKNRAPKQPEFWLEGGTSHFTLS